MLIDDFVMSEPEGLQQRQSGETGETDKASSCDVAGVRATTGGTR